MRDARERSSVALLGRKALAGEDAEAAAVSAGAAGDAANRILQARPVRVWSSRWSGACVALLHVPEWSAGWIAGTAGGPWAGDARGHAAVGFRGRWRR